MASVMRARSRCRANETEILCFGEIAWDRLWVLDRLPGFEGDTQILREQAAPGGCALNSAACLAALGAKVTLTGNAVGDDAEGREIRRALRAYGVRARIGVREGRRTPFCQVFVEEGTARRSFALDHREIQSFGRLERAEMKSTLVELRAGRFSHAFVQPYTRRGSLALLHAIRELAKPPWVMIQDVEADSPFVPLADAVQLSLGEAAYADPSAAALGLQPFLRGQNRLVIGTCGPAGAVLLGKGCEPIRVPSRRVAKPVDTTGCGDAFRAGLLYGLWKGWSLERSASKGAEVAARKARVYGSHLIPAGGRL